MKRLPILIIGLLFCITYVNANPLAKSIVDYSPTPPKTSDTIKLTQYHVSTSNADNAKMIAAGIQAAINKKAKVVVFPSVGVYRVKSSNYWTIPDNFELQIDGKGATIEVV